MARFWLLLQWELKLFRASVPIHLVAIIQPTVLFVAMAVVLVHPTFELAITRPTTGAGQALVAAMREVGSPIGMPYIAPILVDQETPVNGRQIITVAHQDGGPVAIQRFGLIDSNIVKNLRNRLTAAALRLWNAQLGTRAVSIEEHPWLPRDMPYTLYFGMALLPTAAFVAASMIGAVTMAADYELNTITELRLAPIPASLLLAARLARLVLASLLSASVLLTAIGLLTGVWPRSLPLVALVLTPIGVIAGCLTTTAGLITRSTIPSFIVALVGSFGGWLLGGGFGLAAGFGGAYEAVSRFVPNSHAVELLFPMFYGMPVGSPIGSVAALSLYALGMLLIMAITYHRRVLRPISGSGSTEGA